MWISSRCVSHSFEPVTTFLDLIELPSLGHRCTCECSVPLSASIPFKVLILVLKYQFGHATKRLCNIFVGPSLSFRCVLLNPLFRLTLSFPRLRTHVTQSRLTFLCDIDFRFSPIHKQFLKFFLHLCLTSNPILFFVVPCTWISSEKRMPREAFYKWWNTKQPKHISTPNKDTDLNWVD